MTHSCILWLDKWSNSRFQNVIWYHLRNFQNQFLSQRSNLGKVLFLSLAQVNNTAAPRVLEEWNSNCDGVTLGVCRLFKRYAVCVGVGVGWDWGQRWGLGKKVEGGGGQKVLKGSVQILYFLKFICLKCHLGSVGILFSHLSLQFTILLTLHKKGMQLT